MSYYEAEEDDLLFATNYGIGWYSAIQFPSVKVWMAVGQLSKFSPQEKAKIFQYYQRGASPGTGTGGSKGRTQAVGREGKSFDKGVHGSTPGSLRPYPMLLLCHTHLRCPCRRFP